MALSDSGARPDEAAANEYRVGANGWIAVGALVMAASVAAGAFAAHGFDPAREAKEIDLFHTGSLYQALHGLAMLMVAGFADRAHLRRGLVKAAQWLFLAGVVLFPGSLYLLALHGPRWLGIATPFGGSSFILGWLMLAAAAIPRRGTLGRRA
jgi:uncharacterized membrane protein YgdD (TMEM256/DUF423 family)